eukprot:11123933-Karenia_brevis.AAC.1
MAASQSSHQHFVLGLQNPVELARPAQGPQPGRPSRLGKKDKRSEEFKQLLQLPFANTEKTGLASRLEAIATQKSQEEAGNPAVPSASRKKR